MTRRLRCSNDSQAAFNNNTSNSKNATNNTTATASGITTATRGGTAAAAGEHTSKMPNANGFKSLHFAVAAARRSAWPAGSGCQGRGGVTGFSKEQ